MMDIANAVPEINIFDNQLFSKNKGVRFRTPYSFVDTGFIHHATPLPDQSSWPYEPECRYRWQSSRLLDLSQSIFLNKSNNIVS